MSSTSLKSNWVYRLCQSGNGSSRHNSITQNSHGWSDDLVEAISIDTQTMLPGLAVGKYAYVNDASCLASCSNSSSRWMNASV